MRSLNIESYLLRVSSRFNYKIMFQVFTVAIEDQVNAGPEAAVANPGEIGESGAPLSRIIAVKIVGFAGQFLLADDLRGAAAKAHSQPGCAMASRQQEASGIGGEAGAHAKTMHDIPGVCVCRAAVPLKGQGGRAEGSLNPLLVFLVERCSE